MGLDNSVNNAGPYRCLARFSAVGDVVGKRGCGAKEVVGYISLVHLHDDFDHTVTEHHIMVLCWALDHCCQLECARVMVRVYAGASTIQSMNIAASFAVS